ncbi:MAG: hypothetical protein ACRDBG_15845 [Waterburya sp.]
MRLSIEKTDFQASHFLCEIFPKAIEKRVKYIIESNQIDLAFEALKINADRYEDLLMNADKLLYPSQKEIDIADSIFDSLVEIIAVFAFLPNGVEFFGCRYEVKDGSSEA